MKLFTIHLFNTGTSEEADECITFYRKPTLPFDITEVLYEPQDGETSYRFWMARPALQHYIEDLIESLTHDVSPYDNFQVTPASGPPIIYHVGDLTEPNVRRCILNTIHTLTLLEITAE